MTVPRDPHRWVDSWAWPIIERGERLAGCADLVLLRLAAYGNDAGVAWPSTRTLAARVGRSDRAVRDALEYLRNRGFIDGYPQPKRKTTWRFVTDPDEQRRLRNLRTTSRVDSDACPDVSANPSNADSRRPSATHLRTICDPVPPTEVEVEELLSLTHTVEQGPVSERAATSKGNLYAFRSRAA